MDNDRTALIGQPGGPVALGGDAYASGETCPHCSSLIPPGEEFCLKCGFQRGTWAGPQPAAASADRDGASTTEPAGSALWKLKAGDVEHPLYAGKVVLGRGDVEIPVNDGFASRRHAQLDISAEQITLADLGSSNGTFVGERRLEPNAPEQLGDGAQFRIGNTLLTVTREAATAETGGDATLEVNAEPDSVGREPMGHIHTQPPDDDPDVLVDPSSQPEPGKEGSNMPHVSVSHWELHRDGADPVAIELGELTIGRKADSAAFAVPDDNYISGLHARLIATETTLQVTDLGSTNGTFVNEARLEAQQPWELAAGDKLRLGQTTFSVVDNQPVTEAEAEAKAEDGEA